MGLDMYLYAKRYTFDVDQDTKDKLAEVFPEVKAEIKEITAEAAYWRKANAIHGWFVNNIQGNVDDCGEYNVDRQQIQDLVTLCKQVLSNKTEAEKLLPPTPGFFFGAHEVDDWYMENLTNTIEQLEACLKYPEGWYFTYSSSW